MKIKSITILFCFIYFEANSQSFLSTDIGNSILLRPNLGYEYRWKKQAFGSSIQWQRNAMFWLYEFPSIIKTEGIRTDFYYKYFFYKSCFIEPKLRLQTFEAPCYLDAWRDVSLYNSKKSIEFAMKLGFILRKDKKLQFDFGAGAGYLYRDKSLLVNKENLYVGTQFLTVSEILEKYPNKFQKETGFVPHVQLRMFYKIK